MVDMGPPRCAMHGLQLSCMSMTANFANSILSWCGSSNIASSSFDTKGIVHYSNALDVVCMRLSSEYYTPKILEWSVSWRACPSVALPSMSFLRDFVVSVVN